MRLGYFLQSCRPPAALLLACGAIAGCANAAHTHRYQAGAVVGVTERDFQIDAPAHLPAGPVTLRVSNEGPNRHELIIAPSGAGTLPLRHDGMTVAEELVEDSEPGHLEPGQPGSVRDLRVSLAPGRYVFFCNMEGHYMGGMHREVTVG